MGPRKKSIDTMLMDLARAAAKHLGGKEATVSLMKGKKILRRAKAKA